MGELGSNGESDAGLLSHLHRNKIEKRRERERERERERINENLYQNK